MVCSPFPVMGDKNGIVLPTLADEFTHPVGVIKLGSNWGDRSPLPP